MSKFMDNRWIQQSQGNLKQGALRRQLKIKEDKTIPIDQLENIVGTPIGNKCGGIMVTRLLKMRANWALNVRGGKKK
jgi:hypothetical protein